MAVIEPESSDIAQRTDIAQQRANEGRDEKHVLELSRLLAKADPKDEGYAEEALKGAEILDGLAVKLRDGTHLTFLQLS